MSARDLLYGAPMKPRRCEVANHPESERIALLAREHRIRTVLNEVATHSVPNLHRSAGVESCPFGKGRMKVKAQVGVLVPHPPQPLIHEVEY